MSFSQTHVQLKPLASPVLAEEPALTHEEWKLVLKALSAYQHHTEFRTVYEKLRKVVSDKIKDKKVYS